MKDRKTILTIAFALSITMVVLAAVYKNTEQKNQASADRKVVGVGYISEEFSSDNNEWLDNMVKTRQEVEIVSINNSMDDNTTGIVSREIFSRYFSSKQEGLNLSENSIISTMEEAVNNLNTEADKYSINDLPNITKDISPQKTREYGNSIALVMEKHSSPQIKENELSIFLKAVENEDPEYLKNLDIIIASYQNIIRDLKNIYVPENFVSLHIELLNNTEQILKDIEGMRGLFNDVVKSIAYAERYLKDVTNFAETFKKMREGFKAENIVFESDEKGSFFNLFK